MTQPQSLIPNARSASLTDRRRAAVARGVGVVHPIALERGEGAVVWDADGRRYFDFIGGIGTLNLGHAHPRIVAAIAEQAARLTHTCFQVASYEGYVAVAEALNRRAPGPTPKKTLLLSTGAEAVENAVKIAREHTHRPAAIAFHHSYHGRTLLALSLTGKNAPYKQHYGPFCSEIYHAPYPYEHHGFSSEHALRGLEELFESSVAPDRVAAIILEPILGEGGFVPAPRAFVRELREITQQHGIVLIVDEIQTGFGRTGTFFACEQYGIEPDLMTVAKSIAGGLPLAAVVGKAEIMDAPGPGGLGGTFAGNPIACAAALATFEIIDEAFLARARTIGARIESALRALQSKFAAVEDVRGFGAMMAMELSHGHAEPIVEAARERGLLLMLAGSKNVIRILVPLVIDDAQLDEALGILADAAHHVLGG
jgi:4-aminobutyrate aminotransferase/(S)-3-amino-2-methylpropionate transaminase